MIQYTNLSLLGANPKIKHTCFLKILDYTVLTINMNWPRKSSHDSGKSHKPYNFYHSTVETMAYHFDIHTNLLLPFQFKGWLPRSALKEKKINSNF